MIELFDAEDELLKEAEADDDFKNGRFDIVNTAEELKALFEKKEREIEEGK